MHWLFESAKNGFFSLTARFEKLLILIHFLSNYWVI